MRASARPPTRTTPLCTPSPLRAATMTAPAASSRLGRLSPSSTALFLCDIQERFATGIRGFDAVADVSDDVD